MQLFADIQIDGQSIRDRWPSHNLNTVPLAQEQTNEFEAYLTGQQNLPLSRLLMTTARLYLERGQYSLAILQAATAVELKITQIVSQNLRIAGWSEDAIKPYERMSLGRKVDIPPTDPRSLVTYFATVTGFADSYMKVRGELTPLRNRVAHHGLIAAREEAINALAVTSEFLGIVS